MEIINTGGYDLEGILWHQHSNKLMVEMLKLFPKNVPVLDLGCGHNWYATVLDYVGYQAIGCDAVDLKSQLFFEQDLTQPMEYETVIRQFTTRRPSKPMPINVISLEVGEHIPSHLAIPYLDNLTRFGGDILMSWALPGQAGVGHVNCQPLEWVTEKMRLRGYALDFNITHRLRQSVVGCHCSWFQNTLMYFKPIK